MNFMNVSSEQVSEFADAMRENGHIPCLCKFQNVKVSAPTRTRKTQKFTITVEIGQSAFTKLNSIPTNFGGVVMLGFGAEELAAIYRN